MTQTIRKKTLKHCKRHFTTTVERLPAARVIHLTHVQYSSSFNSAVIATLIYFAARCFAARVTRAFQAYRFDVVLSQQPCTDTMAIVCGFR